MEQINTLIKQGNNKLPKDILIFNMSSATDCPSKALGLCKVCDSCYAMPPEKIHPDCKPYRDRQEQYWLNTSAKDIAEQLSSMLKRKRKMPTKFRFNESGDFHSQACVDKLDYISKQLKQDFNIVTFGYTARADLVFEHVSFLVKGSGNDSGNNGDTIVIDKPEDCPEGYYLCPGSCFKCSVCASNKKIKVAFVNHNKRGNK
jgi:hypothetical protein